MGKQEGCDCNGGCEEESDCMGWLCSRCGLSLAPMMDVCPCSYQYIEGMTIMPFKVWTFKKVMACINETTL